MNACPATGCHLKQVHKVQEPYAKAEKNSTAASGTNDKVEKQAALSKRVQLNIGSHSSLRWLHQLWILVSLHSDLFHPSPSGIRLQDSNTKSLRVRDDQPRLTYEVESTR
ncbi:hypothetical protein RvY_06994 [Ramazzottius varieornatus]|uniref:Uncharacterized protein n=1 Tax=Ramazzottius varieornatus TaxID=947166 RepID=A0A1D1V0I9_RAMVA|nr:hypothetical protein RvY_06994 [Ramazzottius varieornatus]